LYLYLLTSWGSGGAAPSRFDEFFRIMGFWIKYFFPVSRFAAAIIVAASWATTIPAQAGTTIFGPATVTDGDTIKINGTKIRIHGIDGPERKQTCKLPDKIVSCGLIATEAMKELVRGKEVICQQTDTDRYGRTIAICHANGVDIGQRLVQTGWALAYRRYSKRYVADEDAARIAGHGMWQGAFVKPWDWRRGVRLSSAKKPLEEEPDATSAPPGCQIKGNISRSGKIYHVPGSRWYAVTKINVDAGERMFCSVSEAEQAGWRAPR
jgi:endonuclease YncB( thermonuclease family)